MLNRNVALLLAFSCVACATVAEPSSETTTGDGDVGDGDSSVGDGDGTGDGDTASTGGVVVSTGSGGVASGGTGSAMTGGSTGSGGSPGSGGQPEGPLLLQDDFESGLSKWTLTGTWSETSDGSTVLTQTRTLEGDVISSDDRGYASAFAGGPNWSEYTFGARVKLTTFEDNSNSYAGLLVCASTGGTGIVVGFKGTGEVRIRSVSNGARLQEGSALEDLSENELVIAPGTWYGVEVILLAGGTMQVKIDGEFYAVDLPEGYVCNPGGVGLVTERAGGVFDDVYVSTQ